MNQSKENSNQNIENKEDNLKIDFTKYEIFYLKYKKYIISSLILLIIGIVALVLLLLYSLGFLFNSSIRNITYQVENIRLEGQNSIVTNYELKIGENTGSFNVINTNKNHSLVLLVDNKKNIIATNVVFKDDKNIVFSPKNTVLSLALFTPHFLFLEGQNRKEIFDLLLTKDFTKSTKVLVDSGLEKLMTGEEFSLELIAVQKDQNAQRIIANEYNKLSKNKLPGYVNFNKVYPWSIQMDNYKDNYNSVFKKTFGLNIIDDKNTPRLENSSFFYKNLTLVPKEKIEIYKNNSNDSSLSYGINDVVSPTFLSSKNKPDMKELEELELPDNFPNTVGEYNLLSLQTSNNPKAVDALGLNLSKYFQRLLLVIENNNLKKVDENLDRLILNYLKECKNRQNNSEILNCIKRKVRESLESRYIYDRNTSTTIFIDFMNKILLESLTFSTSFEGMDKTSIDASFLYFFNSPYQVMASLKLKPPFTTINSKFNNSIITYDGSYDITNNIQDEKSTNLIFNKRNIEIKLENSKIEKAQYYCTNDLDLSKINNFLYKSFLPKWDNQKLNLVSDQIIYFKTNGNYTINDKIDKISGIVSVTEADTSLYKNCFRSENLAMNYNNSLLRITANKIDNSKFTEGEFEALDKFVDTINIVVK